MAHTPDDNSTPSPAPGREQAFVFHAAGGRVYAENTAGKLIDLGALSQQQDGWAYLLDGNKMGGGGFASAERALRDIAGKIRFLYLDGQFTAVADARDDPSLNLDGATRIEATLDALAPGEPAVDATV